ncbi:uncharacterized protein LOC133325072 [Musca vetustissima]|uniref:uncharacterized protein LOC133325072 n=1 Tax=Musca vetustissima TaxID=27455 RepID=UPI002AB7EEDD|nr:uncharacterized protein LOC133325072 [Musca vetustissima]
MATTAASIECDNYYQISDDDLDDCEDLPDDCLLEEADIGNATTSQSSQNNTHTRGPYERAWTTDATRALIHIRGPMEHRFTEGRQKRTALWLHCTRQLQKMGFRYSAGKVQKKWHNILITYNKNLSKKFTSGYVHWEFFEEMYKYLQGKKADFNESSFGSKRHQQQQQQQQQQTLQAITTGGPTTSTLNVEGTTNNSFSNANSETAIIQPHVELDSKSNDDFDEEDSNSLSDLKKPKLEVKDESDSPEMYPIEINDTNNLINNKVDYRRENMMQKFVVSGGDENARMDTQSWWQDYFDRKLQVEREKIEMQKEMHRELMQFNKMSLLQQEKIERIKIEAINNLTSTLQKLVEVKYKKL